MNGEYIALFIAIALLALGVSIVPRRRSYQDELDENAKRVEKDRLERMQK